MTVIAETLEAQATLFVASFEEGYHYPLAPLALWTQTDTLWQLEHYAPLVEDEQLTQLRDEEGRETLSEAAAVYLESQRAQITEDAPLILVREEDSWYGKFDETWYDLQTGLEKEEVPATWRTLNATKTRDLAKEANEKAVQELELPQPELPAPEKQAPDEIVAEKDSSSEKNEEENAEKIPEKDASLAIKNDEVPQLFHRRKAPIPWEWTAPMQDELQENSEQKQYQIEITKSAVYHFYAESAFDSYGYLHDASGRLLTKNDDGHGHGYGDFKLVYQLEPGVYVISISSYANKSKGKYTLYAQEKGTGDDNFSFETATSLRKQTQTVTESMDFQGDYDYFKLEIPNDKPANYFEEYTFSKKTEAGLVFALYDANHTEIVAETSQFTKRLSGGTYYLSVRAQNTTHTGKYQFETTVVGQADANYDRQSSVPLELFRFQTDALDFQGDADYFRIEIPEKKSDHISEIYQFYVTSSFDSYGVLYHADGQEITQNDDGNGDRDFLIARELAAGTYYLKVSAYKDTFDGFAPYQVRVDCEVTASDGNDSLETAQQIVPERFYFGRIDWKRSDRPGADKDYFWLEIKENESNLEEIYWFYAESHFDSYGVLYDAAGNIITKNDDGNGNRDFLIKQSLAPGRYYLEVQAYNGQTTGEYAVRVDCKRKEKANEDFSTAKPLKWQTAQHGKLDGKPHFYQFEVTETKAYTLTARSDFDSYGILYDARGNEIATNDDGYKDRDFLIEKELTPGIYYLKVKGYASSNGSYTLFSRPSIEQEISWMKEAIPLSLNQRKQVTDTQQSVTYYEYYVPNRQAQSTLLATHQVLFDAMLSGQLTVLNSQGQVIQQMGTPQPFGLALHQLTQGRYFFKVETLGSYTLQLNYQQTMHDTNYDLASAETLQSGEKVTAAIDFAPHRQDAYAGDEDYFKLFIPDFQAARYQIEVIGESTFSLVLLDEKGKMLHEAVGDPLFEKLVPGLYYVRVRSTEADFTGSYTLSLDQRDDMTQAASLPLNQAFQKQVHAKQGSHYYRLAIHELRRIKFHTANQAAMQFEIFDAKQNCVIKKAWTVTNHELEVDFVPGVYYVKISTNTPLTYKLFAEEFYFQDNEIDLIQEKGRIKIYLNHQENEELTHLYYQMDLTSPIASRFIMGDERKAIMIRDFIIGAWAQYWTSNGTYPILDELFNTDIVGLFRPVNKSKAYAVGQLVGDLTNIVVGAIEIVNGAMIIVGGGGTGMLLSTVNVAVGTTVAVTSLAVGSTLVTHGTMAVLTSMHSMQEGYRWDPELDDEVLRDGSHFDEDGNLKPNTKYQTGEFDDYLYETDELRRIADVSVDELKLTTRSDRVPHNPNTPGKELDDHAGHLIADRFGGSPGLDNLISQFKMVNWSDYRKLENIWANAIKNGQKVSLDIKVNYQGNSLRPDSFEIEQVIDGFKEIKNISNNNILP